MPSSLPSDDGVTSIGGGGGMEDRRNPLETMDTESLSRLVAVPSEMIGIAAIASDEIGCLILTDVVGAGEAAVPVGADDAEGAREAAAGTAAGGGDERGRGGDEGTTGPALAPVVRPGEPRIGEGRGGDEGRSGCAGSGAALSLEAATSVTTTTFLPSRSSSPVASLALASVLEMSDPFRSATSLPLATSALALGALISRATPSRPPASISDLGVSLKPPPRAIAPVGRGPSLW